MTLRSQSVTLDRLSTHPRNVRQGDVGAITASLEAHGQYRPVVVQRDTGHVLAGNHTLLAARALGWKSIDVVYVDVDDDEALRILLTDNRTSDLATYDDTGLAELLKELALSESSLVGTGFDGDELDDLLFRLNQSHGTDIAGSTPADRLSDFTERGIRSMVLPYPATQFNAMQDSMRVLREKFKLESNADLVALLVSKEMKSERTRGRAKAVEAGDAKSKGGVAKRAR